MEPTLPAPNINPERAPVDYGQNLERTPLLVSPEISPERAAEQFEQRSEAAPAVVVNDTSVLPTPVVVPVPIIPMDDATIIANDIGAPVVAADDDVIEKEWVDKAKKIIAQTKDDPHTREREVAKLQIDYLRKRYGKDLGSLDE